MYPETADVAHPTVLLSSYYYVSNVMLTYIHVVVKHSYTTAEKKTGWLPNAGADAFLFSQ